MTSQERLIFKNLFPLCTSLLCHLTDICNQLFINMFLGGRRQDLVLFIFLIYILVLGQTWCKNIFKKMNELSNFSFIIFKGNNNTGYSHTLKISETINYDCPKSDLLCFWSTICKLKSFFIVYYIFFNFI